MKGEVIEGDRAGGRELTGMDGIRLAGKNEVE